MGVAKQSASIRSGTAALLPTSPPQQHTQGSNLYQYVRSHPTVLLDTDGLQTSQPAKSSQVCCKYHSRQALTVIGAGLCPQTVCFDRRWQETRALPANTKTGLKDFCCCGLLKSKRVFTTVDEAKEGECCWCKFYSCREGNWRSHHFAWLVCEDDQSAYKVDFYYHHCNKATGWTCGQSVSIIRQPKVFAPSTGEALRFDCATGKKVLNLMRQDKQNPPDYNIIQDCRWYVGRVRRFVMDHGYF